MCVLHLSYISNQTFQRIAYCSCNPPYNFYYRTPMDASDKHQQPQNSHNLEQIALNQVEQSTSVNPSAVTPFRDIGTSKEETPNKVRLKKVEPKRAQKGVEDNPEYYRVDLELASKLYEIYRRVKSGAPESGGFTFEQMEQSNTSMNYHKIVEMLKQAEVKLEINQKLTLLRSIKKFSFNQNFISKEEFTKIFKVVVHGLGIRETTFKPLVKVKYTSLIDKETTQKNQRKPVSIKINKNFGKLKTEPPLEKVRSVLTAEKSQIRHHHGSDTIDHAIPRKDDKNTQNETVEDSKASTARRLGYRKRIATEVSRYEAPKLSYLNRAMEKNKLNVLSWDSLFQMSEATLSPNVSIPSFITKDIRLDDLYF